MNIVSLRAVARFRTGIAATSEQKYHSKNKSVPDDFIVDVVDVCICAKNLCRIPLIPDEKVGCFTVRHILQPMLGEFAK